MQVQYLDSEQKVLTLEKDLGSLQRELRHALDEVAQLTQAQKAQADNQGEEQLEREVLQARVANTQADNLKLLGEVKRLQDEVSQAREEAQRYHTDNELYVYKLEESQKELEQNWAKHQRQASEKEAEHDRLQVRCGPGKRSASNVSHPLRPVP